MATNADTLDEQLAKMLEQERFEPPDEFRVHATLNDPSICARG